jgi:hypothetical protein
MAAPFLLRSASLAGRAARLLASNTVSGPDGLELALQDCGAEHNSCAFLVVSSGLVGNARLAMLLRALGAFAVLAFLADIADTHGAGVLDEHIAIAIEEGKLSRTLGRGVGQPILIALADALGFTLRLSMHTGGAQHMNWECYTGATPGSQARFRGDALYVWHTGAYHFQLGLPHAWKPAWADASAEEQDDRVRSVLNAAAEAALHHSNERLRAAAEDTAAFFSNLLDAHPIKCGLLTLGGCAFLAASTGVGAKDKSRSRRPDEDEARALGDGDAAGGDVVDDAVLVDGDISAVLVPSPASTSKRGKFEAHSPDKRRRVKWSTLLDAAKSLPVMIVDTSALGVALFKKEGKFRCSVPGCGAEILALDSTRPRRHYDDVHKGNPPQHSIISYGVRSPTAGLARDAAVGLLAAAGLSANQVACMGHLIPVLAAAEKLPSRPAITGPDGVLDREVAMLEGYLADKVLADIPVVLVVDGSSTHFAGGKKVLNVVAVSSMLDHAVLLLTQLEDDASITAEYIRDLVLRAMAKYKIKRENVVGLCSDNASVNLKAARLLDLPHIPCAAHVINLMVQGVVEELEVGDILGLRLVYANSQQRMAAARKAGAHPNRLMYPETRFAYAIDALNELSVNWDVYAGLLAGLAALRGDCTAAIKEANKKLHNPEWKAHVLLAVSLTRPGYNLLQRAEADPSKAREFWPEFTRFHTGLVFAHEHTEDFVDDVLAGRCELDEAGLDRVCRRVEAAVESADDKVLAHLMEEVPAPQATSGRGKRRVSHKFLRILRRRDLFMQPLHLPDPSSADWPIALGGRMTQVMNGDLAVYGDELRRGAGCKFPLDAAAVDPVRYWRAVHATGHVPALSHAALAALSIPFSNASVERTFSVLSNREIDNRLRGGERYVANTLTLACNSHWYHVSVAERLRGVLPKWSAAFIAAQIDTSEGGKESEEVDSGACSGGDA